MLNPRKVHKNNENYRKIIKNFKIYKFFQRQNKFPLKFARILKMTEESTIIPKTQVDFVDLDDLKMQYSVLKKQRDTYKLLLSNYEKMFLQEGVDINALKKENEILLSNHIQSSQKLQENSLIFNNSPKSLRNFLEIEGNAQYSPENSPLNLDKKQRERNISLKIEKLNQEINAFKEILEEKSEILNVFGSETRLKNEKNPNIGDLAIKQRSLSIKNPQDNDIRKLSSKFSIDNVFSENNHNLSVNNSEENLRNQEIDKSVDSACQMQAFFKEMAVKLQSLEENNACLSNQVENGAKEKEDLQRKLDEMRKEIEKLNKLVEDQKKDNEIMRIEKYMREAKKQQKVKESICKNLCNLI